jgi:type II secretory pathway component PulJ
VICCDQVVGDRPRSARSRGFTLLEALIAIALIMALVGAMFGFLFDMFAVRASVLAHFQQQQAAAVLIRQLDADLTTSLVGDTHNGPGLVGDSVHLRILTRGVMTKFAERGVDNPDAFGDLQVAEYRFDPATNRLEGRRYSAMRGGRSSNSPPPEPFEPAGGIVHKLRFRYHDGATWRPSFNTLDQGRLPAAVELAIWTSPLPRSSASLDFGGAPLPAAGGEDQALSQRPGALAVESAAGMDQSSDNTNLPPPDRIRIFTIPDAGGG